MNRRFAPGVLLVAGLLLLPVSNLLPANITWTGSNGTSWDYATQNWTGDATTFTDGDNVVFDASTANRTVVPSGTISPGRMDVTAPSYFFDGGTLGGNFDFYRSDPGALAGNVLFGWNSVIDVSGINNIDLSGAGGYTSFCGTTTLGNASYDLTVHPGAILCLWDNTLALVKNNIYSDGGVVYSSGYYSPTTGLSATNLFQLQGIAATQIQQGTGVLEITSGISSAGGYTAGLIITRGGYGSGTTRLSGSNSYAGDTMISNTTVELNSSTGSAIPGNLVLKGTAASSWLLFKAANQMPAAATVSIQDGSVYKVLELLGQNVTIAGIASDLNASGYGIVENTQTDAQTGYGTGTLTINTVNALDDYYYNGYIRDKSLGSGNLALVKDGPGKQTIDSPNCGLFTGPLTVKAGTLALGGSASTSLSAASIEVKSGAVLDVSQLYGSFGVAAGQTLKGDGTVLGGITNFNASSKITGGDLGTAGTLALEGGTFASNNGILHFDLADVNTTGGGVNDYLTVGTALSPADLMLFGGTVEIQKLGSSLATGTYHLIHYTGTLSGGSDNLALSGDLTTESRSSADLQDEPLGSGGNINLVITYIDPKNLLWAGTSGEHWDLHVTQNWSTAGHSRDEKFFNLDHVTFDNTGYATVPLDGTLAPGSITIASGTTQDYTFTGSGRLTGNGGITKNGSGKLIIANSGTNDFSGPVAVNEGILQVGDGLSYGVGTLGTGNLTIAGSCTLSMMRPDDATLSNNLGGSGNLRQDMPVKLTLAGDNSSFSGSINVVPGGTLASEGAKALDFAGTVTIPGGAVLDVNGQPCTATVSVEGDGLYGYGAIINSNISTSGSLKDVTLTGDVTFGGDGRVDIIGGSLASSTPRTIIKTGTGMVYIGDSTTDGIGEVDIQTGSLYFGGTSTLGESASTSITIEPGATLGFWDTTVPETKTEIDCNEGIIASNRDDGGTTNLTAPIVLSSTSLPQLPSVIQVGSGGFEVASNISSAESYSGGLLLTGAGAGTIALSGNNSYAGDTVILDATVTLNSSSGLAIPSQNVIMGGTTRTSWLQFKAEDQIPASAVLTFQDGSRYKVVETFGHSVNLAGLSTASGAEGYGIIENSQIETGPQGTGVFTINTPAGTEYSFNGWVRSCSGVSVVNENPESILAIVKDGPGKQSFAGNIVYTGSTTINDGVLEIGSSCTLPGDISGEGLLQIGGEATTLTATGAVDLAAVTLDDSNTLILAPTGIATENTLGQVTGSGGTLQVIDSGLTVGSVQVNTLTIGEGAKLVISPRHAAGAAASGPVPIPEPSTLLLLTIAFLALIGGTWRKFRSR